MDNKLQRQPSKLQIYVFVHAQVSILFLVSYSMLRKLERVFNWFPESAGRIITFVAGCVAKRPMRTKEPLDLKLEINLCIGFVSNLFEAFALVSE